MWNTFDLNLHPYAIRLKKKNIITNKYLNTEEKNKHLSVALISTEVK